VFNAYNFRGNATARSIDNGIDLSGEGGMVWVKGRQSTDNHYIWDTERGATKWLRPSDTNAEGTTTLGLTAFNSNGFTLGNHIDTNRNNHTAIAWTFRKKKKFFDIVTFSGNGTAGRTISHGLGGPVGMVLIKRTDTTGYNWTVWHKSSSSNNLFLNTTGAQFSSGSRIASASSTTFTVGTAGGVNNASGTYVAYIFADNSSEDAEEQMIKCGTYTGTGASVGASVTLGWEPQFLLIKPVTASGSWTMMDTMRGIPDGEDNTHIIANTNATEVANANWLSINTTGFKTLNGSYTDGNVNGVTYMYMAIRGPMMVEPKAATDVFAISTYANSAANAADVRHYSGFPVDTYLGIDNVAAAGNNRFFANRKTHSSTDLLAAGREVLLLNTADGAVNNGSDWFNTSSGIEPHLSNETENANSVRWMWKRAKGFFDVVPYTGTGANATVSHSLGAVPEMIWVKRRNGTNGWFVYTADAAGTKYLHLQDNYAYSTNATGFNNTAATTSVFSVGTNHSTNRVSGLYIAYLFASLDGISKVGSYTGTGSDINVNCGFSAGARFILIKRTDSESDWVLYDSTRGIVAGADPFLNLNDSDGQDAGNDGIDPLSSGFIVTSGSALNVSSGTYIFYAIA
tara:strand:- start:6 stop:1886 length:1881 start_codon:yes stop_codon:yes gene_type:complete